MFKKLVGAVLVLAVMIMGICICSAMLTSVGKTTAKATSLAASASSTVEPTLPAYGARDNPYPVGRYADLGDVGMAVQGVVRPATDKVIGFNMFNKKPGAESEYMQVTLELKCNKSAASKCLFSAGDLKVVGSDGVIFQNTSVAGDDKAIVFAEFFGGATSSGRVYFIVTKGDEGAVMFYDPIFGDDVYFEVK